ncbi:hypothetical protein C1H46_014740 [Malus baccata]|uniref:Uncharacterized protein n=1 Tax=Malus baccata TaxID=106549 RepID=A0A540MLH2_MALBA|nr:hypothetical protein C1H46_014740 [Malus baccata]
MMSRNQSKTEDKMESGPLRKVRMGCSLKVEDEVGHSDDIDTEKGLRRSKRVGYFLRAIKDHTKQEERKVNKQSKKKLAWLGKSYC